MRRGEALHRARLAGGWDRARSPAAPLIEDAGGVWEADRVSRRSRWKQMPPRRRMAWWYGFAAAYTIAAVVLLILTVWIPAAACAVIGVGLASVPAAPSMRIDSATGSTSTMSTRRLND